MERTGNVDGALARHASIYGSLKDKPETWDSMIEAMGERNPWEPSLCGSFYDEAIPKDKKVYRSEDGNTVGVFAPHGQTLGRLTIRHVEVYGPWREGDMNRYEAVVRIDGFDSQTAAGHR